MATACCCRGHSSAVSEPTHTRLRRLGDVAELCGGLPAPGMGDISQKGRSGHGVRLTAINALCLSSQHDAYVYDSAQTEAIMSCPNIEILKKIIIIRAGWPLHCSHRPQVGKHIPLTYPSSQEKEPASLQSTAISKHFPSGTTKKSKN